VDVADFNTWDVSDGSEEGDVFIVVDEERASAESISFVPELAFTGSDVSGVGDSFNIVVSTELLEEGDDVLGLFNAFDLVVNNQRKVGDVLDSVTSGKDEGSQGRSSQSGGNGVSLLLDVDLSVPSSPGLQGGEHSTFSTRVGEGTLSGSGGTTSTDSWNSCDGTTGSPRLGRVLHTCLGEDSVSLTSVLGDLVMDKLNNVKSDGGSADCGESDSRGDFTGVG